MWWHTVSGKDGTFTSPLQKAPKEAFRRHLVFCRLWSELLPLVLVRLFSNSAATGLALDLFKSWGPDSEQGLLASLFLSSTETVFYTMSIYFMSVKIKKTRYTLQGALLATLAGIVASVFLVKGMR